MNVVLVQPPRLRSGTRDFTFKERLPHVGLAYLAGSLRQAGHRVAVIDGHVEKLGLHDFVQRILSAEPNVVGLTANTYQITDAAKVASALKEAQSSLPVALGGYHVSPIPEQTMAEFPPFDVAVLDEGEETMAEWIPLLAERSGWETIRGLAYRSDGLVFRTPSRPVIRDLDALPWPAYDLFPVSRYYGIYSYRRIRCLPVSTARGCPYRCNFCQNPGGTLYRHRSIESVVAEMASYVKSFRLEQVLFTDETFTLNRRRTLALCEGILGSSVLRDVRWVCETRVDAVDRELLALMKKAGCMAISMGVESGNQTVLDRSLKKTKNEEAIEAVRLTRESGIFCQTNFIMGHPHETEESLRETIAQARRLGAHAAGFSIMTPFPGTEIARMAERGEGGLRIITRNWSDFTKQVGGALELETLPRATLERYRAIAYLKFYLHPRRFLNIFKVSHVKAIPVYMFGVLRTLVSNFARPLPGSDQPVTAATSDLPG